MKKIFFLFFLICSIGIKAQVSGYMGKRLSIGYSGYFFPRIQIASGVLSSRYDIATVRSFNYTHNLDADFILNPMVSLCLTGQFSTMDLCKNGSTFFVNEDMARNSYTIYYYPRDRKNMELKTTNVSVGFKFFKERYMNPFGRYRKVELIMVMDKVLMDKNEFYYNNSTFNKLEHYELPEKNYQYKSFVIAYTMGKQRILFNKIILDYGLRLGLNYNFIIKNTKEAGLFSEFRNNKTEEEETLDAQLKEVSNLRIFQSQLVNVHIGLRFLAF